jgi:hypothetical protein
MGEDPLSLHPDGVRMLRAKVAKPPHFTEWRVGKKH